MTGIIMDEHAYAQKRIDSKDLGDKPREAVICVIKYYRDKGFNRQDTRAATLDFIQSVDRRIDIHQWEATVDRYLRRNWKTPTVRIQSIPITQDELDKVRALPSERMRRLLFSLICYAKFADMSAGTRHGWINRQYRQIFQNGNVHISVDEQCDMIRRLKEMGLISTTKKIGNLNIKVECIDWDGEPVINVTNLQNTGYQYSATERPLMYKQCESCGMYIKKQSGNSRVRRCEKCAKNTLAAWERNRYLRSKNTSGVSPENYASS